jgi:putative sigma-54 modulation protein
MQILIASRKVTISRTFQASIRSQLAERLRRFTSAIESVQVELVDRNGRRGGGDKQCRIQATVKGVRIACGDVRANLRTAVRHAIDQLEATVHRQLRSSPA